MLILFRSIGDVNGTWLVPISTCACRLRLYANFLCLFLLIQIPNIIAIIDNAAVIVDRISIANVLFIFLFGASVDVASIVILVLVGLCLDFLGHLVL